MKFDQIAWKVFRVAPLWLGLAACQPPAVLGQSTACLTADPMAGAFVGSLRRLYANPAIDSTQWKQGGMPFATGAAITLATDNATCTSALKAYKRASNLTTVTQVYVAKIGTTGYVVMTPQDNSGGDLHNNYWFNTKWLLKQHAEH